MAACPFRVDLTGARVERGIRAVFAAHFFDDVPCVGDEELVIVRRAFGIVEQRCGAGDGGFEPGRINVDVVPLRECLISLAAKCRTRIDEREIDIEHDRFDPAHVAYGPAMTTDARSTDRYLTARSEEHTSELQSRFGIS